MKYLKVFMNYEAGLIGLTLNNVKDLREDQAKDLFSLHSYRKLNNPIFITNETFPESLYRYIDKYYSFLDGKPEYNNVYQDSNTPQNVILCLEESEYNQLYNLLFSGKQVFAHNIELR